MTNAPQPDEATVTEQPPDEAASTPTDRPEPSREIGNVIYVWQMHVQNGWNIIGMLMPNGQTMPLVRNARTAADGVCPSR